MTIEGGRDVTEKGRMFYTIPSVDEGDVDIVEDFVVIPNIARDTAWIARGISEADAALIVDAVNAYDRLRAIGAAAREVEQFDRTGGLRLDGRELMDALRAALEVPSDAR